MITLINSNRMTPPIAPVGLDYVASALRDAGEDVTIIDLAFADDVESALRAHFDHESPELIGLTLRNTDDCFWPHGESFVPKLVILVAILRDLTRAPIVLGGAGYSVFPKQLLAITGAHFGVQGDGEAALLALLRELRGSRHFERVPGLVWRDDGERIVSNPPAWPTPLTLTPTRDNFDNVRYFREGGQLGIETKRGCPRQCIYCADRHSKGATPRLRNPADVADEFKVLLGQGIDVIHLCDSEFNIPREHAVAVCRELIARGLGNRLRWYTYMAVLPFDEELARLMAAAGCVGINFTGDSASSVMLATYRQPHGADDIANAVALSRTHGMRVMIDLLLGGPGETPESVAETISLLKDIDPDCAGASLGVRVYPGTQMHAIVAGEGPLETNPNLRRHYAGVVDWFKPTFYIASALGENPARLVRELIGEDLRFFPPAEETPSEPTATRDHNYNDNTVLTEAICNGARGAYWDILRGLRQGSK